MEEKVNKFVNQKRNSLPHSIDDEDLDSLSNESGFTKQEIKEANQEIEDFWKREDD